MTKAKTKPKNLTPSEIREKFASGGIYTPEQLMRATGIKRITAAKVLAGEACYDTVRKAFSSVGLAWKDSKRAKNIREGLGCRRLKEDVITDVLGLCEIKTATALAEKCGIAYGTASLIMKYKGYVVTRRTLDKLCEGLGSLPEEIAEAV